MVGACMIGACMAGSVCGRWHAWQGVCAWWGTCMVGVCVCGGGHEWWVCVCVVGGHVWWVCVCMVGGVRGRGHVWQGACMVPLWTLRDTVSQCTGGTHATGMHSCLHFVFTMVTYENF